jgi:hypothetical protein
MSWISRPRMPRMRPSESAAISIHRTAQQGRGGDRGDVFGIDAQFWAKTAADVGRGDAQPAFVEIDIVGQRIA